eukprot:TRINITY_DN15664_c0_g1_i1.p1 TRINITY_DN15664_c0_g1~~TRINITY_DN15664_c0_g1_i1.p1  ORF type:complete len:564 (-),score=134.59 TRINITY_DN15664_c0_g1_i1:379-2070(-)
MNVLQAVQDYLTKMITDLNGMKVLLLDAETIGIVSMAFTQSQLLAKDVYLTEKVTTANRERMPHLKALIFIRPTSESIAALIKELQEPKYSEYHIIFSNYISEHQLQSIAESDEHELVTGVFEMFADFFAVHPNLFSLNMTDMFVMHDEHRFEQSRFDRMVQGVMSVLLSLKKRPIIRSSRSTLAQHVASEVNRRIESRSDLFDFRRPDTPPVLLVLDRRDDPVTPLLNQWTYQAMVHEILGINNNRVSLKGCPGVKKELEEMVLGADTDQFFLDHMFDNFAQIGDAVKALVDHFQAKTQMSKQIDSIADMKAFVEEYPEFRKLSGSVSKHVTVMSELSRVVDEDAKMQVSELEQSLACVDGHDDALHNIASLARNPRVKLADMLKIVLLYHLRYESKARTDIMVRYLEDLNATTQQISTIRALLQYAGISKRSGDLFKNKGIFSSVRNAFSQLKDITNIYTQHQPVLVDILLDMLVKGKLSREEFPFVEGSDGRDRPQEVIVFIVGGATYEESVAIHQKVMALHPGVSVVLGGTTVHNSASFIADVQSYAGERSRSVSASAR